MSTLDNSVFCVVCENAAREESRRLASENAKLKEQVKTLDRIAKGNLLSAADHERSLEAENAKLRELLQRLLTEYRYMRSRPRRVYLQHEGRMRAIEEEMRELGIEAGV